jgi:hypothetical protein
MKMYGLPINEKKEKSRFRYGQFDGNCIVKVFNCAHCHGLVHSVPALSGVQNRDHCPYCLWSRHLDMYRPGDRLSACKSLMQPIGLTTKHIRKKYGSGCGELMLIHVCCECRALSINRIAADDDPEEVMLIFKNSFRLLTSMREKLHADGICILDAADQEVVYIRLFGQEFGLA